MPRLFFTQKVTEPTVINEGCIYSPVCLTQIVVTTEKEYVLTELWLFETVG